MAGSILGERVLRKEDPKFLTTGGVYVDDMVDDRLAGAAHVVYVRSSAAHGTILSIDTDEARTMPGVIAVFTAADLELQPTPSPFNPMVARTLLAIDKVRYVGEPVVAVVTETPAQGEDAAESVIVDIDFLPAVVDIESAGDVGDLDLRERRQQRRVRHDRARHAREHRRRVLRRLRGDGLRPLPQPARRPVPARGSRRGRRLDRRSPPPVGVDPARPGNQGHLRRRQRGRRRRRARHHARCGRRVRRQDRLRTRKSSCSVRSPSGSADRSSGARPGASR